MSASSSINSMTICKSFRADKIAVILKFGFQQTRVEYLINDVYNSIIQRLYEDAKEWLRVIVPKYKNEQFTGTFTIFLFRITATEFTMVPIRQSSDIEQDALIEIVLVPTETSANAHMLYQCQLAMPTNCSKCSRFIAGLYKQGVRCHKCRMPFHIDCSSFLLDDCPVKTDASITATTRKAASSLSTLRFIFPSFADPAVEGCKTPTHQMKPVPIFRSSIGGPLQATKSMLTNKIIDKGIFPACIRGAHFYQRYLFCLTMNVLSISPNLSTSNVSKEELSTPGEADTIFPLTDITNLVLTHSMPDRDDVYEIHIQNKIILSIGKRSDSESLQMETAQFYSSLRYTRETLITTTTSLTVEPALGATPVTEPVSSRIQQTLPLLSGTKSIYRYPPLGDDNQDKDFHELYQLTNEKLGEGAFGRVMKGFRKSTKWEVAIKIMEKANCSQQDIKKINEEISNLCRFNHPSILKLEAYFERDNDVYLITERMETDLCNYITNSKNGYLDEDACKMITYQVIVALRCLHAKDYGHLDVKCDNILVTLLKPIPSANGIPVDRVDNPNQDFPLIKLADFGYSRIIGEHSFRKTHVGTKVYNAPEIYHSKQGYNKLADIWSVGVVLYAGLTGTLPFDEKTSQLAEQMLRDKRILFSGSQWERVSKDAIDLLINKLLIVDSNSRVNSNEVIFHNWFTDFDLYRNLLEIERRTRHLMRATQQEPPSPSNWLTKEREDPVWKEYKNMYAELYHNP